MPAVSKRSAKRAGIVVSVLLTLAVGAWASLRHPDVRAQLNRSAAAAFKRELGLDLQMGSVHFAPPLRLVGEAIRVSHPEHGLLASAQRLSVQPSLLGLLLGELRIKRITLVAPRVRVRIENGEVVNFPDLPFEGDERKSGSSPLRMLQIQQGSLLVDALPAYRARIQGLSADAALREQGRLELSVRATDGSFERRGQREVLTALSFAGFVTPGERVEVIQAEVETSLGRASAKDAAFSLPLGEQTTYRGQVELATDLRKLESLPLEADLPDLHGKVSLRARGEGRGRAFSAEGELHAENPELAGFGFGFLDLRFAATPEEIRLLPGSQGEVIQNGGTVLLEGRLGLSEQLPLEIRTDIRRLEFHKLMAQLGVTDNCLVNWVLKGGFKLSGTANPVAITGPIWADHVSFAALTGAFHDAASEEVIRTTPGKIAGRVVVRPDALRFENLVGKLKRSLVKVSVHVGFDSKIGVTARSEQLDLDDADHLMGMPIRGRGAFSLDVGGTYDNTTLEGTLDLSGFELDGYRVGHIESKAILEKGGVAVRFVDSQVTKGESRYVVDDMLLDFERAFSIDARARIQRLSLSDFYHTVLLDEDPDFTPYQGHLQGEASVRYTLGFPGDDPDGTLRVETVANVLDARLHDVEFDSGRLAGSWTWRHISEGTGGAELKLDEARFRRARGSVVVGGSMGLGTALNFTVFGERLSARRLIPEGALPAQVRGELGFVGTVRGSLALPKVTLDLNLLGVRVDGRVLGDGHLRTYMTHRDDPWVQRALTATGGDGPCLTARRALARASWPGPGSGPDGAPSVPHAYLLCGSSFGDRLKLDLAVGAHASLPLRGRADLNDVPASWFLPKGSTRDTAVKGVVSGALRFEGGGLADPDSLVGAVQLSKFELGIDRAILRSEGSVQVALTGRGARIERAAFVGEGTRIEASGGGSKKRGLAAKVTGRIDLGVLKTFVPSVLESAGSLSVDVKLSGEPEDPSIFGSARVHGGMLLLSQLDRPLHKIEATMSFSEHELLLETLDADLAGGRVSARGSAAVSANALGHYELFIAARDVSLSPMGGVDVAFAADTKLVGGPSMRIPLLSGTLRLSRAVYRRPVSLGLSDRLGGLSQARRVVRDSYDPSQDRVAFDLRVVEDSPLKVANNLLTAELSIQDSERPFQVVGTDQRPGVLGTLELKRGTLVFRNTQFVIDEGTVTFNDQTKIRPRLDVTARTDFRRTADASGAHWLISLHAFGEADNLTLETSSVPALAREDIALLLTVGLTRAEAERLGTAQLTQGAALEALASVTGLDREVKKALPVIDDFAVTSAYSARTNRTEPQVVVGKRLSDRVRATATTGLNAESNFKTGVQWRLNNQTSLEAGYDNVQTTTSSQFGNVGVDLRWRLEFD